MGKTGKCINNCGRDAGPEMTSFCSLECLVEFEEALEEIGIEVGIENYIERAMAV